jgi:hypothetical protein
MRGVSSPGGERLFLRDLSTATLVGNSVGENTFRKTQVDNSGPALSVSTEAPRQAA